MKKSNRHALNVVASLSPVNVVQAAVAALLIALPGVAAAVTEVTPSITVKESFVDTKASNFDDSGAITSLTPGVQVTREGARSSLLFDYRYNIVRNHGYDQDDRESHLLNFFTNYQHRPGIWVSSLRAGSRLTNIDPNGVQNTNLDIVDDNTTELHTLGVDSVIGDRLTDSVGYRARVNADAARYDDSDDSDTDGYGFLVGLDNERSPDRFLWNASFDSQTTGDDDDDSTIDTSRLILRYLLSREWSSFVSYTKTDTDFEAFDDDASLVGLTWQPNSRNRISLGVGERGDDSNYFLDAVYSQRHYSLTASYSEDITTARADTLRLQQSDAIAQPTSQSLSTVPVLQKRASLNLVVEGKYSVITVSAFQTDRSEAGGLSADELTTGLRFRFTRNLSARDRLSLDLLEQETEETETNELSELTLTYTHLRSPAETLDFSLGLSEQTSTNDANEYERSVLSAQYRVTF